MVSSFHPLFDMNSLGGALLNAETATDTALHINVCTRVVKRNRLDWTDPATGIATRTPGDNRYFVLAHKNSPHYAAQSCQAGISCLFREFNIALLYGAPQINCVALFSC